MFNLPNHHPDTGSSMWKEWNRKNVEDALNTILRDENAEPLENWSLLVQIEGYYTYEGGKRVNFVYTSENEEFYAQDDEMPFAEMVAQSLDAIQALSVETVEDMIIQTGINSDDKYSKASKVLMSKDHIIQFRVEIGDADLSLSHL